VEGGGWKERKKRRIKPLKSLKGVQNGGGRASGKKEKATFMKEGGKWAGRRGADEARGRNCTD